MTWLANRSDQQIRILLALLGALLFIPFLGQAHLFDWDEINFAEAAREMIASGNYSVVTIDYEPFWEKPPLFFWMQVISMKLFGVNEFAARLPNAICGIITLVMLFNIGKRFFDKKMGVLWALVYAGSLLPHFYFKSGIIDPWFNLFIFLGIYHFAVYSYPKLSGGKPTMKNLIFSAAFIGLAIMTKGPVGFLIFALTFGVYWAFHKFKLYFSLKDVIIYALVTSLVGGMWFIIETINGRSYIVQDFIDYQIRLFETGDSGHGQPFFYHWIVLLFGCFPASLFMVPAFRRRLSGDNRQKDFVKWMIILFWVVLLLFSIVKTKIVHYSSMCYFPLTFLAAYVLHQAITGKIKFPRWTAWATGALGIIFGSVLVLASFMEKFTDTLKDPKIVKDPFARANMEAESGWTGFEFLPGTILILATIYFLVMHNRRLQRAVLVLFIGGMICVNLITVMFASNIEAYSQRAAIEFYEEHADDNCYIYPLGFKSYAHLFYSKKQPTEHSKNGDIKWLLEGDVDRCVYFVTKVDRVEEHMHPNLVEMYRKNGFVFLKRVR